MGAISHSRPRLQGPECPISSSPWIPLDGCLLVHSAPGLASLERFWWSPDRRPHETGNYIIHPQWKMNICLSSPLGLTHYMHCYKQGRTWRLIRGYHDPQFDVFPFHVSQDVFNRFQLICGPHDGPSLGIICLVFAGREH